MFYEKFENRIAIWADLRKTLETHPDPLACALSFWNKAPLSSMTCDLFDRNTWLKAWDMIEENKFCEFSKMLALCYTLLLTDRFGNDTLYLAIITDRKNHEMLYLLHVDDYVLGYDYQRTIHKDDLPKHLETLSLYAITSDQV